MSAFECVAENPKISETMREVVDGSIELVLQDNGKSGSSATATSTAIGKSGDDANQMPPGFSLIFHENKFDITEK